MTPFEVFQAALELATEQEQDAFVDSQSDAAVRTEVRSLLNALRRAGGFLGGSQSRSNRSHESALPSHSSRMSGPETEIALSRLKKLLGESPDPNAIGLLGHYSLQEILGIGGYGIVLRAFDEKLHRMVAVKILIPKPDTASAPHNRFLEEARSAAAIKHENVVQVHSVEETPIPYIVMEYIHGPTLHEFLNQEAPLETATLVSLSRQIASGLAASHDRGFVHRDIKPGNILVEKGDELRIKLTDFGLAQMIDDPGISSSGDFIGTPSFTSPEQARSVEIDSRSDLFSLGSVMYQMACGHPPFRAKSTHDVLQRVLNDTPRPIQEIRPSVPDWFCQIVERLQAKNPEQRIQSASQLAKLLLDCEGNLNHAQQFVEQSELIFPNRLIATKSLEPVSETIAFEPIPSTGSQNSKLVSRSFQTRLWLAVVGSVVLLCGAVAWFLRGEVANTMGLGAISKPKVAVALGENKEQDTSIVTTLPQVTLPSLPAWSLPENAPLPLTIPSNPERAKELQSEWAEYIQQSIFEETSIGLSFALVPPGEFDKTYTRTRDGIIQPWMPTIRYRITKPFRVSTTEVTVDQFRKFVDETGYTTDAEKLGMGCNTATDLEPSLTWKKPGWQVKPDQPVTMVTDIDAKAFCDWLSEKENRRLRLPRESEWIHACRAGSDSRYVYGKDHSFLASAAWTRETGVTTPSPVGKLLPNPLGLFDMFGNVWERSLDYMEHHAMVPYVHRVDPVGLPMSNTLGSCFAEERHLTHSDVMVGSWSSPAATIGFRVVEEIDPSSERDWKTISLTVAKGDAISDYAFTSKPTNINGLATWSVCVSGMQSDHPAAPAWNPMSNEWIVGGNDGGLSVFNKDGVFKEKLFGPTNRSEVKISPDGNWVVAKDSDGPSLQHLYVWYWPERKLKAILPTDDRYWLFSPDSSKIAFAKMNRGPWNNWGAYEFDLVEGVTRSMIIPRIVDAIAWHPSGDRVVCQTWLPQALLEVFEYPSMKLIASVPSDRSWEIMVSPDGKRLAIPDTANNVIRIREFESLKEIQAIAIPSGYDSSHLYWYSDSERLFIAGANPPKVVSASTGTELFQVAENGFFSVAPRLVEELDLIIGPKQSSKWFSLFNAEDGSRLSEWKSHNVLFTPVQMAHGTNTHFFNGNRRRSFSVKNGELNVVDEPFINGPWGMDRKQSRFAGIDQGKLVELDLETDSRRSVELRGLENAIPMRLICSNDGSKVAYVYRDQHLKTKVSLLDSSTAELICDLCFDETESEINSIEWSPDDKAIAFLMQNIATELLVFDVSKIDEARCDPVCVSSISAVANELNTEHRLKFCRDGSTIVIATRTSFYEFDTQSRVLKTITTPRLPSRIRSLFVRPDSSQFALTHRSFSHYFCNVDFKLFSNEVKCPSTEISWSNDNKTLVFHQPQLGFRFYDSHSMRHQGSVIPFLSDDHWLVCSPDGHYRGSQGIESLIVYVVTSDDGSHRTYSQDEFFSSFGWKNEPNAVSLPCPQPGGQE